MDVSIGWWTKSLQTKMVGNHPTSIYKWLFGVPKKQPCVFLVSKADLITFKEYHFSRNANRRGVQPKERGPVKRRVEGFFFPRDFLCFFSGLEEESLDGFYEIPLWICLVGDFFGGLYHGKYHHEFHYHHLGECVFWTFPKHRFQANPSPWWNFAISQKKTWAMLDGDDHFWTLRWGSIFPKDSSKWATSWGGWATQGYFAEVRFLLELLKDKCSVTEDFSESCQGVVWVIFCLRET